MEDIYSYYYNKSHDLPYNLSENSLKFRVFFLYEPLETCEKEYATTSVLSTGVNSSSILITQQTLHGFKLDR